MAHFSCFYPASWFPAGFFRPFLSFLPCFMCSGGFFRSFLLFLPCFLCSGGVFSPISLVFTLLLVFRWGFFAHFSCFCPASRFPAGFSLISLFFTLLPIFRWGFFAHFSLFCPASCVPAGFFLPFLLFLPCFMFSDGVFSLISLVFALLLVFRRGFFVHFFLFYHASCFPAGFNPCRHPPSLPCLQQLPALQS